MPKVRSKSSWDNVCYICKDGGVVICCEGPYQCRRVAHSKCVKLATIPEKWFCYDCRVRPFREYYDKEPISILDSDSDSDIDSDTDSSMFETPLQLKTLKVFNMKKLKVLELFKGTGSVTKYCNNYPNKFATVINLDNMIKWEPTILTDIQKWPYGTFKPPHYFDIIWASPPCTQYSIMRTTGGPRDIESANAIVDCTLKIIEYFQPTIWFLENPGSGKLKDQEIMKGIDFIDVDYCQYGDFGYRKYTRIWTNMKEYKNNFVPKRCMKQTCKYVEDNRHINTFGSYQTLSLEEKYRVPQALIHELFWEATCIIQGKR